MRVLAIFALSVTAATASAQVTKAPATKTQPVQGAATKAPAPATKAAPPQTKTVAPQTKAAPPETKAAAPQTKTPAPATNTATKQARPTLSVAPQSEVEMRVPTIMRELFEYDAGGRRDPFFSLLPTAELRPAISDLRLVTILYDESGRRPVAVMRDVLTNTQYRVTTGMTLGRLRVALIKRRVVIFSIEEFGLNRQDSLVLGDPSKVRGR